MYIPVKGTVLSAITRAARGIVTYVVYEEGRAFYKSKAPLFKQKISIVKRKSKAIWSIIKE
jgi:hypothetical protein